MTNVLDFQSFEQVQLSESGEVVVLSPEKLSDQLLEQANGRKRPDLLAGTLSCFPSGSSPGPVARPAVSQRDTRKVVLPLRRLTKRNNKARAPLYACIVHSCGHDD